MKAKTEKYLNKKPQQKVQLIESKLRNGLKSTIQTSNQKNKISVCSVQKTLKSTSDYGQFICNSNLADEDCILQLKRFKDDTTKFEVDVDAGFKDYRMPQYDGLNEPLTEYQDEIYLLLEECQVPQYDGLDDESSTMEITEKIKTVFGINCENEGIIQLISFVRSFNFLWIACRSHPLCFIGVACFFCNIRSSVLRLRQERNKGPFLLKLNEFICHIDQYESKSKFNFLENLYDIQACINNTLQLINLDVDLGQFFSFRRACCKGSSNDEKEFILNVQFEDHQGKNSYDLLDVVTRSLVFINMNKSCCKNVIQFEDLEDQCLIINFHKKEAIDISDKKLSNGFELSYRSHIEMKTIFEKHAYFRFNNQVYSQKSDSIYKSSFGTKNDMKMIAIFVTRNVVSHVFEDVQDFIYDHKVLLKLHKRVLPTSET